MDRRYVRFAKRQIRNAFVALVRLVFGALALATRLLVERGSAPPAEVRKILVIRLDLLGDLVLSMPAVRALRQRYPQAHIAMLVLPYTAPLLAHYAEVDRVFSFDVNCLRPSGDMANPAHYRALLRLLRDLRAERYDLAVSLHGLWASALAFLSGAHRRVGYRGESLPFTCNLAVPGRRYAEKRHEVEYNLVLAGAAGAGAADGRLALVPLPAATARVGELLAAAGVGPGETLVAIHPGATNGAAKRWLSQRWAAVADRLGAELGVRVVLTGSAAEVGLVEEVAAALHKPAVLLAGRTSVVELVALLARCRLVLCGDSAPLHLAVALGVPTVAIHGPTDPRLSGPYGAHALVVRRSLPCSSCYDLREVADCPYGRPRCMEAITVDEVYAAARRQLEPIRQHKDTRAQRHQGLF